MLLMSALGRLSWAHVAFAVQPTWIAAIVLIIILNCIVKYRRLCQYQGPWTAGISDFWLSRSLLGYKSHLDFWEVNKNYGEIARIGPSHLLTSSPELYMHISANRTVYSRTPWFYRSIRIEPGEDHLLSQVVTARHDARRKQMAPGYSGKENPTLESDMDSHIHELIALIERKYLSTDVNAVAMDLAQKLQFLALDVVSHAGLGTSFGDLEVDDDRMGYIASTEIGLIINQYKLAFGLSGFFEFLGSIGLGPSDKDEAGFGRMIGLSRNYIEQRLKKQTNDRSDMIASFVRHGLSDQAELVSESILQILAGTDTTSVALRASMLHVMTQPGAYLKLRREIDEHVSISRDEIIAGSDAKDLRYLNAFIRESIRLHPPVADLFPRRVPQGAGESFTLNGVEHQFPAGTDISYSAWGTQRNPRIFGHDANVFRPERWLPEHTEKEQLDLMHKANDLIFGYGKWHCLGSNLAWAEIRKTVTELVRRFDWGLVNPEQPWKSHCHAGLFFQEHMWVRVTRRD